MPDTYFGEINVIENLFDFGLGVGFNNVPSYLSDKRGADRPRATNDAHLTARNLALKRLSIGLYIGLEHADRTMRHMVGYEFI